MNRKGGLNYKQFRSLLASESLTKVLGGDITGLYRRLMIDGTAENELEIQGLFEDAVEFLEEN